MLDGHADGGEPRAEPDQGEDVGDEHPDRHLAAGEHILPPLAFVPVGIEGRKHGAILRRLGAYHRTQLSRLLTAHELCQHRLAADRGLTHGDHAGAGRQVDIDAAAEADEPDALASCHASPLAHESHDPPRDQPGDQHRADLLARIRLDDKGAPLVLLARLVELGVQKRPGT